MIEITDKKHPLSTHAEVTEVAYFLNAKNEVYATRIYYKEGQVVDGKLIPLGNFDKEIIKPSLPVEPAKSEPAEEYQKELAEYNTISTKLAGFSKAENKILWAEGELK